MSGGNLAGAQARLGAMMQRQPNQPRGDTPKKNRALIGGKVSHRKESQREFEEYQDYVRDAQRSDNNLLN